MNCEKCGLLIGHGTMGTVTPLCQCGWSSKSELKRLCVQDPIGMAEQLAEYKQRAEAAEAKLRELEMQEPYGYWIQHPYTANVRFSKVAPDTQVMAMSQHIVTPLYAKPFPKQEDK